MDATVSSLYIYPDSDSPGQQLDSVEFTETGPRGNRAKKHAVHLICADDYVKTHPKANVILDIGSDALVELVGKAVKLGEATLRVTREPTECLGVYAEVVRTGEVAIGDRLLVADDEPPT
ncbi:MAG: hypothetical protein L0H25_05950 [Micrococcales bacterium]|nr:hypothetical protein [Micrococcales bacterium]